jgi:hypothetical protein
MPVHRRHWNVEDITLEEMADCIANSTFVLCQGFRCDGILWLHDSMVEGEIQEWAVVREKDGRQLESITTGWISEGGMDPFGAKEEKKQIIEYHKKFVAGAKPMFGRDNLITKEDIKHEESCLHCR